MKYRIQEIFKNFKPRKLKAVFDTREKAEKALLWLSDEGRNTQRFEIISV